MRILTKIGLGISLYLTIISTIPFLPFKIYFSEIISPFPQNVGHITGDIYASLWASIIFISGLIGFAIFIVSKTKKTIGLQILLSLTIIYCLFNIYLKGVGPFDIRLMFYIINFTIGLICFLIILQFHRHRKEINNKEKTPPNN